MSDKYNNEIHASDCSFWSDEDCDCVQIENGGEGKPNETTLNRCNSKLPPILDLYPFHNLVDWWASPGLEIIAVKDEGVSLEFKTTGKANSLFVTTSTD